MITAFVLFPLPVSEWGSSTAGGQGSMTGTEVTCVLQVPEHLPEKQRFDIQELALGLLVNLVEYNAQNWHCLTNMEASCSFDSSFCSGEGVGSLRMAGQVHAIQALVQVSSQLKTN
ncbi:Wings apart-like protein-like protein [Camelus dromedarius]|uniref:Wings apart-like protein-like protein n=1 Tax=Camelus dromedarius TaxID=9838 RepID=A0A5N4DK92_CAMDR|nr:Wings apart-like protein-like protein [Camelus dromedarius]